jgi:hypothetical protein
MIHIFYRPLAAEEWLFKASAQVASDSSAFHRLVPKGAGLSGSAHTIYTVLRIHQSRRINGDQAGHRLRLRKSGCPVAVIPLSAIPGTR